MWDLAILVGFQSFVFILMYIALNLDRDNNRILGVFIFFAALFMQQHSFSLMIKTAEAAGQTAIADTLGLAYGNYPMLIYLCLLYYGIVIMDEIIYRTLGYDMLGSRRGKEDEQ